MPSEPKNPCSATYGGIDVVASRKRIAMVGAVAMSSVILHCGFPQMPSGMRTGYMTNTTVIKNAANATQEKAFRSIVSAIRKLVKGRKKVDWEEDSIKLCRFYRIYAF